MLAAAAGEGSAKNAQATAILESCAILYAAGFAAATLKGASAEVAGLLTPPTLALMARNMLRRGEDLHLIDVRPDGSLSLLPIGSYDLEGDADPRSWWVRADVYAPSGSRTMLVPHASVLHARYAVDPVRPWAGVSPLGWSSHTDRLAGGIEVTMGNEAGAPSAQVVPIPEDGRGGEEDAGEDDEDPLAPLRSDIVAARGNVLLLETTSSGFGLGSENAPRQDWKQVRLGPDWPDVLRATRNDLALSIAGACNVPSALLSPGAEGTSQRESLRRFAHLGLQPVAKILLTELREKLEQPELDLDFSAIQASDMAGRARAFRSFVEGGLDLEKAAQLSGVLVDGE
ncbi:MAG: hypothetical protein OXC31_11090 [Spirochaetaceae bacterium]|nr:hypothetical protein [Spirochaetaceae bacterium]